jgi:phospholipase/carboxylesterase
MNNLGFIHQLVRGSDAAAPPLLLLHGTGGNEHDLLPLGQRIAPGRTLLSPRGRVLENGMPRFFKRFAEGRFDEESVIAEAAELAGFIAAARQHYGLPAPIAVGYSNGANIAAALLQLHPGALAGAVLMRGMVPLAARPDQPLGGLPVLLLTGASDHLVPAENAARLAANLTAVGAVVGHHVLQTGHGITEQDLELATAWLARAVLGQAATP